MLKRAQEIQQLDDAEEESRNIQPVKPNAQAKELSVRESKKTREYQLDASLLPPSQQLMHQKILEQEKLSRQVFKEEISNLHCSGTRDLNTK
jgi:hypothetical protein